MQSFDIQSSTATPEAKALKEKKPRFNAVTLQPLTWVHVKEEYQKEHRVMLLLSKPSTRNGVEAFDPKRGPDHNPRHLYLREILGALGDGPIDVPLLPLEMRKPFNLEDHRIATMPVKEQKVSNSERDARLDSEQSAYRPQLRDLHAQVREHLEFFNLFVDTAPRAPKRIANEVHYYLTNPNETWLHPAHDEKPFDKDQLVTELGCRLQMVFQDEVQDVDVKWGKIGDDDRPYPSKVVVFLHTKSEMLGGVQKAQRWA